MKLRLQSAFIMTTFNYEDFLSERLLPVVFSAKHLKKGGAGGGREGGTIFLVWKRSVAVSL